MISLFIRFVNGSQISHDIVKEWDVTMDGATRYTHRLLDGQIRDQGKPFEVEGMEAQYPFQFGIPSEDINCRCCALTRAKWALDEDELKRMQAKAEYFQLDKSDQFELFREKYLNATKTVENTGKSGKIEDGYRMMLNERQVINNSDLMNGLPFKSNPDSITDKVDDGGKVLQRRVYGNDGYAYIDFDTSDHGMPQKHTTGAHKHQINTKKGIRMEYQCH